MSSIVEKIKSVILSVSYVLADHEWLTVELSDGRRLSLPLKWFPRLLHGSPVERNHWRLIGGGEGIHWPELDEDLSLEGFLAGRKSQESSGSLKKWRAGRTPAGRTKKIG